MRTVLRRAPRGGPRLSLGLVCCLPWLPPCLSPRSSRPLVPHALPCSRGACGRRGGGSAGSGGARSGPASWPPRPRERLKPHAIDIRVNIDPVHWFLSPPCDTRSSLYLEDAATEFQVQGLELDWTKSHVGRRLTLVGRRLELSQFSRGEVDGREEAREAAVSEERLPCVAHAGPAGDGDLLPAGGEAGQYTKSGVTDRTALLAKHHATAAANMV